MNRLDPRTNAYRPDMAAKHLEGQVTAARFVEGAPYEVIEATVPVRRSPAPDAALETEALMGERVIVYETDAEGWAWGQLETDGYVGWLPLSGLLAAGEAPTHKVCALRTLGFAGPDIKIPPVAALPFGAHVRTLREHGAFAATSRGFFVPTQHLVPLQRQEPDFVAVAERFLGTPYLWGGKTSLGIDCSGLVQVSLQAAGMECQRDSDMQQTSLGQAVAPGTLQRGDFIFWKGHVAIARDATTIIHANAHHMSVAIEPAAEAIARIKAAGNDIAAIKRLT